MKYSTCKTHNTFKMEHDLRKLKDIILVQITVVIAILLIVAGLYKLYLLISSKLVICYPMMMCLSHELQDIQI